MATGPRFLWSSEQVLDGADRQCGRPSFGLLRAAGRLGHSSKIIGAAIQINGYRCESIYRSPVPHSEQGETTLAKGKGGGATKPSAPSGGKGPAGGGYPSGGVGGKTVGKGGKKC